MTGTRTCTAPVPACGGAFCPGDASVVEACNTQPCPIELVLGTNVFDDPGSILNLTVPIGAGSMTVRAWGAGGAGGYPGAGGGGAFVEGIFQAFPGTPVTVKVASGGASPGGGGGASIVELANSLIVVAGGGGGAGSDGSSGNSTPLFASSGGGAGGLGGSGQTGNGYSKYGIDLTGGMGASGFNGGLGGTIVDNSIYTQCISNGEAGLYLQGGAGAQGSSCTPVNPAAENIGGSKSSNGASGGGGSGYYGGGAGAQKWTYVGSGGGGGSSFAAANALTTSSSAASANLPGGNSAPGYKAGVGQGGAYGLGFDKPSDGGPGLIVILVNP